MESDELKQLKPGTLLKTASNYYHNAVGFKKTDTPINCPSDDFEIPLNTIVMLIGAKMTNFKGCRVPYFFAEILIGKEIALVEPCYLEKKS